MHTYLFTFFVVFYSLSILAEEKFEVSPVGLSYNPKVQQAIELYKNQEHEKAFNAFLDLLPPSSVQQAAIIPEDAKLYQEALAIYLNSSQSSKEQTAAEILMKYKNILAEHPEYYQLGFIVAAAYANLTKFSEFFALFFDSYKQNPMHYMAYKGKAVLHIKLLERARSLEIRENHRIKIMENVLAALEAHPADISLYRVLIVYSPPKDKQRYVVHSLNKIIDSNMMTSRADISFFVEQAAECKEWGLAQKFVDKARLWYQYSRVVDAAQQYLDSQRA